MYCHRLCLDIVDDRCHCCSQSWTFRSCTRIVGGQVRAAKCNFSIPHHTQHSLLFLLLLLFQPHSRPPTSTSHHSKFERHIHYLKQGPPFTIVNRCYFRFLATYSIFYCNLIAMRFFEFYFIFLIKRAWVRVNAFAMLHLPNYLQLSMYCAILMKINHKTLIGSSKPSTDDTF